MYDARPDDVAAAIRALADLAPGARRVQLDVRDDGPFAWIGTDPWPDAATAGMVATPAEGARIPRSDPARRLAELDALHASEELVRLGWVYVVGSTEVDGRSRDVCFPLLTRPVRLTGSFGHFTVGVTGPWDLTPLVTDPAVADHLEATAEFGGGGLEGASDPAILARMPRLAAWIGDVVAALGMTIDRRPVFGPPATGPAHAVVGFGLHAARDVEAADLRAGLHNWAATPGVDRTAWARVLGTGDGPGGVAPVADVWSPLVLTDAQASVVRRSRAEPVVAVSGPPGTGKSHVAAAVALDVVALGGTVLLTARSAQAADVLAGMVQDAGSVEPVSFGGGERTSRLADTLAEGSAAPSSPSGDPGAVAEVGAASASVDHVLAGVEAYARYRAMEADLPAHRAWAPGLFDPTVDLALARRLARRASSASGLFGGWRRRRAGRELATLARTPPGATPAQTVGTIEAAEIVARVAQGSDRVPAASWERLDTAEARYRIALAADLAGRVASRAGPSERRAVAALATALRAGRARRRAHLRSVDAAALTRALPIWVGTLGDVEDLLPAVPGMFDLVVLDESSQIDLVSAAPALLRARRAVVVGDPRQLRFVSFTADDAVAEALDRNSVSHLADRLDVRRVSAFDLAAGASPVTMLDEHFRSLPHIIGFSARRFYDDRLTIASRHPATEAQRCIEVRHVDGERTDDGVNQAEVDAAAGVVDEVLATRGATLGLVTPFRAQADALEAMVLGRADLDRIRAAEVRVGTVHAFQGDERDVMVVSLALDGGGQAQRFLEDPNLFNVLATRARRRVVVLTGHTEPGPGLLADYLRWSEVAPAPHPGGEPAGWWATAVRDALVAGGTPVRAAYPVGTAVVDLVVGAPERAVAVELGVHSGGFDAHRRRHLALRRAGWRVVDAFPARFDADPAAAAVHLATLVG